jgi:hypothetical protein
LHRNDGSGATAPHGTGWAPDFVAVLAADVDGDGDVDVVGHQPGVLRVQRNQGNGTWLPGAAVSVPGDVLLAFDADGDQDLDLLLTAFRLLRNDGTGAFSLDPVAPAGSLACTCAGVADFDGDGDLDVLAGDTRIHMFVNDGTGAFTWSPTRLGVIPGQRQMLDILPFDADNDADVDAFVTQRPTDATQVWPLYLLRNVGGMLHHTTGRLPNQGARGHASAGDLDGDQDIDLVVSTSAGLRDWRNDGSGLMLDAGPVSAVEVAEQLVLADLDGDQDLDVIGGDRLFLNRCWHAAAPFLAQRGRDYAVELGSTASPSCLALPFLGARTFMPVPPFGTVGIDFASAVSLPWTALVGGAGTLHVAMPPGTALVGQQFGVQAVLLDAGGFHLTPTVHDTMH